MLEELRSSITNHRGVKVAERRRNEASWMPFTELYSSVSSGLVLYIFLQTHRIAADI